MAVSHSMINGEGEEKNENSSVILEQKLSHKKGLLSISQDNRLMILQQAIRDYQEAGGEVDVLDLHGNDGNAMQKCAVVLYGIGLDVHGNFTIV